MNTTAVLVLWEQSTQFSSPVVPVYLCTMNNS